MAIMMLSLDLKLELHNSQSSALGLSLSPSPSLPLPSLFPLTLSCLEATCPHVSVVDSISESQLC